MTEDYEDLINDVVNRPRREDPTIDIKNQVMQQIAMEPHAAVEADTSYVAIGVGILVLMGLAIGIDVLFFSNVRESLPLELTAEYDVPYLELIATSCLVPLFWFLFKDSDEVQMQGGTDYVSR